MPTILQRTITIDRAAAQKQRDDGLVEIAISSEAPYERWFGIEILRHGPDAVDLTRLADGRHPLLLNHDTDRQIGVVRATRLDADKVLRGDVQFSRSALGQEIQNDVQDGIRSLVSVGYLIDEIEEQDPDTGAVKRTLTGEQFEREMRSLHGESFARAGLAATRGKDDKPPTFVVTRWTPFEASIVPVPADITVGVGRAASVPPADPASPLAAQASPPPQPTAAADPAAAAPQARAQTAAPRTPAIPRSHTMTDPIVKSAAELEIERRDRIATLADSYGKYLQPNDVRDAIQKGMSVDAFTELVMQRMASKHTDASAMHVGMTAKEVQRYSFGRALVASLTGDWTRAGLEREASAAVEKLFGRSPEGFYVPMDIFRRDFNVGTSTEAGNLVATSLRPDLYTDALRAAMVMGQLGVTYLPGLSGNVDLPRKATAGTLGMVTEIGSASETAPVTAKATLSPKRISAYTEVSKQALIQSAMALENMIRDDLVMGAAVLLENQCINGAGTGANITGLRNVSGIGTVAAGTHGAAPAWSHFVDLESACANANAEPDRVSGYLMPTKVRGKLKQTQFATNLPFIWQGGAQPVNGYRAAVTNNVPSNLTKGTSTTVCSATLFGSDWSMVTVGLFGAPDVTVDPYTKADTGQVKITLNQFADMQHRQPAALAKVEDLLAG